MKGGMGGVKSVPNLAPLPHCSNLTILHHICL